MTRDLVKSNNKKSKKL